MPLVLLCLFSFLQYPHTLYAEELPYWQPVVDSMQAGDYSAAYDEVKRLLEIRPNDALLLRIQGICLLETGYLDGAVAVLTQALAANPQSLACRYYLGQALAYSGRILEAIRVIEEIVSLSPDSEYAKLAQPALEELYNLSESAAVIPDDRRWNIYARSSLEYDDNVPVRAKDSPDTSPTDSWRLNYSLYGEVRLPDQKIDETPLTIGLGYALNGSEYERDIYREYDLFSQSLNLFASRAGTLLDRFYTLRLEGRYSFTRLGWQDYSGIGTVSLEFAYNWLDNVSSTVVTSWINKEYEDDSEYPDYYSNDAKENDIGLRNYFYFWDNRLILGLHYLYRHQNAEGSQYDLRSNDLTTSATFALPWESRLTTQITYQQEDYPEYRDLGRLDNIWTFYASLDRSFLKICNLELYYTHGTADSNEDFANYRRNIIGLALSINY